MSDKPPDDLVTLEEAQKLVSLGCLERTEWFWDRYSPNGAGDTAWRLSKARSSFDNICCLPAPKQSNYEDLVKKYE